MDDLLKSSDIAFGEHLSHAEASEIMRECISDDNTQIYYDDFSSWWSSDSYWASRLRLKRQKDLADIERLFEEFDGYYSKFRTFESTKFGILISKKRKGSYRDRQDKLDSHGPSLDEQEFALLVKTLGVNRHPPRYLAEEVRAAVATQSDTELNAMEVTVDEFYRFLCSGDEIAQVCKNRFHIYQWRLERSRLRPFFCLSPPCIR
eukprot:SAG11_NODE_394_length_9826_cov_3.333607_2_plen_205_part_00